MNAGATSRGLIHFTDAWKFGGRLGETLALMLLEGDTEDDALRLMLLLGETDGLVLALGD